MIGWIEANLDGLVGPTHHYGGLGVGNEASREHRHAVSYPKQAALQGLAKMWRLVEAGIPQACLPPCRRPNVEWLRRQGYVGGDADVVKRANEEWLEGSSAASSSAFMWTANAATVSPVMHTADGCLHMTVANLAANLHRGMEAEERYAQLREMFEDVSNCIVHEALPACWPLRDEGAANHLNMSDPVTGKGIEVFVDGGERDLVCGGGMKYLPRQSRMASRGLARLHRLLPGQHFFLQQSPEAIDAGVFHNDVISTSHEDIWIYHERAYVESEKDMVDIANAFAEVAGRPMQRICVKEDEVSLPDAVKSYLFNSQLVTPADQRGSVGKRMLLLCPQQCREEASVRTLLEKWLADPTNPIAKVEYVPLDQSMANGGGPACLRLRVSMTTEQWSQIPSRHWLNSERRVALEKWVEKWYPERLTVQDLGRWDLAAQAREAIRFFPS